MLAHVEDEGVVHDEALALGLDDVEVVALGVGGGVAGQKIVRRVLPDVRDGQGEREGVRVVFDAVHEAALAGVDFQHGLPVVSRGHGFDGEAFAACCPFGLREGGFADGFAGFEEVAVGVAFECAAFA